MRIEMTGLVLTLLIFTAACSSSSDDGDENQDSDSDLVIDKIDNCPLDYNPDQMASIGNVTLLGDVCDDEDEDAIVDAEDNCPLASNSDQIDTDGNGVGDACETCSAVSLAADIRTGEGSSSPSTIVEHDGRLYFDANDGVTGNELWTYDSIAGAALLAETEPGTGGSSISNLTVVDDKLYFVVADDSTRETELWVYNPATPAAGAYRVTEVLPGSGIVLPDRVIELAGNQYFFRDNELWSFDPDNPTAGSSPVFDINYGFSFAEVFAAMDGKLYFLAIDNAHANAGLWSYDPQRSLAGALLVADIRVTSSGRNRRDYLVLDGKLYLFAFLPEGSGPPELWQYNPTAGASAIIDNAWSYPEHLAALDGKVYIARDERHEIWAYDPAKPDTGTTLVATVGDGQNDDFGSTALTALHDKLYFVSEDSEYGIEIWAYDSATVDVPVAAELVTDLLPGDGASYPGSLTVLDNKLYFSATDSEHGRELWVIDPDCSL